MGGERQIDYGRSESWLARADITDKQADLFYLYPTAWIRSGDEDICGIENESMLEGSAITYRAQATAFETSCNIFSPYYRQVSVEAFLRPVSEIGELLMRATIPDALAAFSYYIERLNGGRPFILAGHSQGSAVLLYLLVNFMRENPEVYKRMIAAYIIGCPVTEELLRKYPHLKFAEGADDTGVIISYNTEAERVEGRNIAMLPGAAVINPISWTRSERRASERENLGSLVIDEKWVVQEDCVKNYADARVDKSRGVVVCSTVDAGKVDFGNPIFPRGVYHSFDYPFYYYNLRRNAEDRVRGYFIRAVNCEL